ncbi:MAG TPA: ribulose-phosphate 3-epimerase [Mycobacteriales bacterium]|nr:ribulose-phosphate 3-epimerase [Mycobacteriales bacterium]
MKPLLAPSILAADFARLADEIARVSEVADLVHVDVMDNHFVPNLTLGPVVVESLRRATTLPMDVHLMIEDPDRWAPSYAAMGASLVTFHVEAAVDPVQTARAIRAEGGRAGLALKPGTPLAPYVDLLAEFDMVLVMTVEPGFGGQRFITEMLPKIREARAAIAGLDLDLWLEVDGGINADTAAQCAEAGADVFVAGSAVFDAADPVSAGRGIKSAAELAAASS